MSFSDAGVAEVPLAVAETQEIAVSRDAVVAKMREAAPPGQESLDDATVQNLAALTQNLLTASGDADPEQELSRIRQEYARFLGVKERGLDLPGGRLREQLAGKTIMVTGGTGCIGTALIKELENYGPARIVSVSRNYRWPENSGVEYRFGVDVSEADQIKRKVAEVKPDIIYHLAAQRDPGRAETEVAETLATNVLGTRNVIAAAEQTELNDGTHPQIVAASTGKALRPVTPDIYAASKNGAETLLALAAQRGAIVCSGARFTHVVDNSIIHQRLQGWIDNDEPVRLHGSEIGFYLQSAREAAQLLLLAGLEAKRSTFTMQAIRDLGPPMGLLDLTLGAIDASGRPGAVYIHGYESGYEETPYPGMYDIAVPDDKVSRLINAWESPLATRPEACPQVDSFPIRTQASAGLEARFTALEQACAEGASDDQLRSVMGKLAWVSLAARLRFTKLRTLVSAEERMRRIPPERLPELHRQTNNVLFRVVEAKYRWLASLPVFSEN